MSLTRSWSQRAAWLLLCAVLADQAEIASGDCCWSGNLFLGGTCADGSPRKFGHCCGNGGCNIFCCNCDGGCRSPAGNFVQPDSVGKFPEEVLDTPLNRWPMIMTHDAATGYATEDRCHRLHQIGNYALTQPKGGFDVQLDCGARALDLRPFVHHGKLVMHHGSFIIETELVEGLNDIATWVAEHPDDLVLVMVGHCDGTTGGDKSSCSDRTLAALADSGIKVLTNRDIYRLTLGTAILEGRLPGGGSLLAVLGGRDQTVVSNYDPEVKCYGRPRNFLLRQNWTNATNGTTFVTDATSLEKDATDLMTVQREPEESAAGDPGGPLTSASGNSSLGSHNILSSYSCIGKESDREKALDVLFEYLEKVCNSDRPAAADQLWVAQAHWQYDTTSIAAGSARQSCILQDEHDVGVNAWLADLIRGGALKGFNLVEVDNVCDSGVEVFHALRELSPGFDGKHLSSPGVSEGPVYTAFGIAVAVLVGCMAVVAAQATASSSRSRTTRDVYAFCRVQLEDDDDDEEDEEDDTD